MQLVSCDTCDDPLQYAPSVGRISVSNIKRTSVSLSATISSSEAKIIKEAGFIYAAPGATEKEVRGVLSGNTLTCDLTGLTIATEYTCQVYVSGGYNRILGPVETFSTSQYEDPQVTDVTKNGDATNNSLSVKAKVSDNGGGSLFKTGFIYREFDSENYDYLAPDVKDNRWTQAPATTQEEFSVVIMGLSPATHYEIYAFATTICGNEEKTAYSNQPALLETEAVGITTPVLGPTTAFDIAETSAKLSSYYSSDGGAPVTMKGFVYSSTVEEPTLDEASTTIVSTTAGNDISATLEKLEENKTYFVRSFAMNGVGTSYGEVTSFVTSLTVVAPKVSKVTEVDHASTTISVTASVTSNGNGTISSKGIFWYVEGDEANGTHINDMSEGFEISLTISNLNPESTICIKAFAINEMGTTYSEDVLKVTTDKKGPASTDAIFPSI